MLIWPGETRNKRAGMAPIVTPHILQVTGSGSLSAAPVPDASSVPNKLTISPGETTSSNRSRRSKCGSKRGMGQSDPQSIGFDTQFCRSRVQDNIVIDAVTGRSAHNA
jgi:hypothetical protein